MTSTPHIEDDDRYERGEPMPSNGNNVAPFIRERERVRAADNNQGTSRDSPPGDGARSKRTPRIAAAEIFAPLPPVSWIVEGLQLCAGRPGVLAGYGASGKTVAAQALALAVASGRKVWNHFSTSLVGRRVLHLDYEQGSHATRRRYQRLALGHGIDPRALSDRLELIVLPTFHLDAPNAYDVLAREAEGSALVLIDSLRASTPNTDENDSRIRLALDNLTRASEATGAAFLVIHHDGKTKESHADVRQTLRGSSGIFDASGCILGIAPGKGKLDARPVHQKKPPAEAEGHGLDDFELTFVDVPQGTNPAAGLRVEWSAPHQRDRIAENRERNAADSATLLQLIQRKPGCSQNYLVTETGWKDKRVKELALSMVEAGTVRRGEGPNRTVLHYPVAP